MACKFYALQKNDIAGISWSDRAVTLWCKERNRGRLTKWCLKPQSQVLGRIFGRQRRQTKILNPSFNVKLCPSQCRTGKAVNLLIITKGVEQALSAFLKGGLSNLVTWRPQHLRKWRRGVKTWIRKMQEPWQNQRGPLKMGDRSKVLLQQGSLMKMPT